MSALRVVLAGYFVRYPLGGYAWQALHFLAGFRSLGCDVFFYEDTAYYGEAYVPGADGMRTTDYGYGVRAAATFFETHGFADAWGFWDAGADRWYGAGEARTRAALADADLFVNLAGVNRVPRAARPRAAAAYVDLDPAYTQLRLAEGDAGLAAMVAEHDAHFTLGENIGTAACRIPTGGVRWRPIRQPIVAKWWEPLPMDPAAAYTTVGKWDATGRDVTFEGETFAWRKRTEWLRFLDLPRTTGERFRVAMDVAGRPDDLARLRAAGWEVADPLAVSSDPDVYRAFVRGSRGEFTVAKDVNVRLRSGWFSDRSACYLAAGRPVVNQDTGFGVRLPVGEGLFAFRTPDDARAAFAAIAADPPRHGRAARALALEYFAPARVLGPMLDVVR
ncbi:MAG: hypothetical protein IT294_18330 [Deltaproteobacteria bacterium]|nr:hypothetical protein [Deltaproteobacteria bacterium]